MRSHLLVLATLAACATESDDLDIDTDPAVVVDETAETGEVVDTDDDVVDPTDSGVIFELEISGQATVARGVKFEGWQAITARWLANGTTPGKPKCIFVQDVVNWERQDPAPSTPNPITADRFDLCVGCEFTFTLVSSDNREVERFPDLFDTDTDTDLGPPDVAGSRDEGRRLNCETLVEEQGLIPPEDGYRGVGFSSEVDGDEDDSTGWVMLWVPMASAWSPYAYTANLDGEKGQFTWSQALPPYEYAWP